MACESIAGVVDQDVDGAETVDAFFYGLFDGVRILHVEPGDQDVFEGCEVLSFSGERMVAMTRELGVEGGPPPKTEFGVH